MGFHSTAGVLFFAALVCATSSLAEDTQSEGRRVQTAMLLTGVSEPIFTDTRCMNDRQCEIATYEDWEVTISIQLRPPQQRINGHVMLDIDCPGGCSFKNGRDSIAIQSDRVFELFSGKDSDDLLYVRKPKIGELSLIIDDGLTEEPDTTPRIRTY
jgi:hypothetical protein